MQVENTVLCLKNITKTNRIFVWIIICLNFHKLYFKITCKFNICWVQDWWIIEGQKRMNNFNKEKIIFVLIWIPSRYNLLSLMNILFYYTDNIVWISTCDYDLIKFIRTFLNHWWLLVKSHSKNPLMYS